MSKTCILVGDRSDIAQALLPYLVAHDWAVHGCNRDSPAVNLDARWDLFLCCIGKVAPVGRWDQMRDQEINNCIASNLIIPLSYLRNCWEYRNTGASACFMAGSNPQRIMPGYLPYNMSKMALLKAVEQIDAESPDAKVFALGPGYYRDSKIHAATLAANWPNERIARGDAGTPIERIWHRLQWCIAQPKEIVGGRNICVSDDWETDQYLANRLVGNPDLFKLRRVE